MHYCDISPVSAVVPAALPHNQANSTAHVTWAVAWAAPCSMTCRPPAVLDDGPTCARPAQLLSLSQYSGAAGLRWGILPGAVSRLLQVQCLAWVTRFCSTSGPCVHCVSKACNLIDRDLAPLTRHASKTSTQRTC